MRLTSALLLTSTALALVGCAGRVPDATSSIDLVLSDPQGSNVNLTRFIRGTDFIRNTTLPLQVTVTENPGPTGVSSRSFRVHITSPAEGSEYALVPGGSTYIEITEATTGGTRVWRSEGGLVRLGQNDARGSVFTLSNVEMNAFSGNAQGRFRVNGDAAIRF